MAHIFFDTLFNIEKYLDHEQKDPFSVIRVSKIEFWLDATTFDTASCLVFVPVDHVTCRVFKEVETDGQELSNWEKYAAEEYDILVAEEAANDQCNDV